VYRDALCLKEEGRRTRKGRRKTTNIQIRDY
jgi:hypothetical protein